MGGMTKSPSIFQYDHIALEFGCCSHLGRNVLQLDVIETLDKIMFLWRIRFPGIYAFSYGSGRECVAKGPMVPGKVFHSPETSV